MFAERFLFTLIEANRFIDNSNFTVYNATSAWQMDVWAQS